MMALLMLTSTLAGCLGGTEEFDTTEMDQQIANLQYERDEMNQTITNQAKDLEGLEQDKAELEFLNVQLKAQLSYSQNLNDEMWLNQTGLHQQITDSQSNVSDLEAQLSAAEEYRDSLVLLLESKNASSDDLQIALNNATLVIQNLNSSLNENLTILDQMGENWWRLYTTSLENIVDLRDAYMNYVNLVGNDLSNAIMYDIDLRYSNLSAANLSGANLFNADLKNVDMTDANLNYSSLWSANCRYSVFDGAYMQYANLNQSEWDPYSTSHTSNYASLINVDMSFAGARFADFSYAYLMGSTLRYADFTQTHFINADLTSADLEGAVLQGSNLRGVDFTYADLTNANLQGADLTGATLDYADLDGVTWNSTICPDGTNSNDNGNTCENNL